MRNPPVLAPVAVAVLVFCAACSTGPAGARRSLAAPLPALQLHQLSEEVERLWGPPDQKRRLNENSAREIWTYRRLIGQQTKQEAVSTKEIPFVDPMTGEMKTFPDPVYRMRRIETHEVIVLTFQQGLLVEWERDIKQSSGFY